MLMLGLPQRLERELRLLLVSEGLHREAAALSVRCCEGSMLGASTGNWTGGAHVSCLADVFPCFLSSGAYYEHGPDVLTYL